MNDTDHLIAQLRDLPPELRDPSDRFEQIGERVRGRRRRHTALAVGGLAVAVALAVPVAAQLIPETAQVVPGGASATDAEALEVSPGQTRVTHLSGPVTMTGSGTLTVQLGEKPAGATGVGMVLDCLSAGDFVYPDGAGMICDETDAGTEITDPEEFMARAYVISLPKGSEEIEITAAEDASWRLTWAYVSTEVTEWGVNANGDTFGVENENGTPDLIAVIATNGRSGYAFADDLEAAGGPPPTSPEDALVQQQERLGMTFSVPVYESDGETVIGEFVIGDQSVAEDDEATTTGP